MRSTKDLIAELDMEASCHGLAAIVVAFENSTLPIHSSDKKRLQLSNDAVESGGSPIGLIAFDQADKGLTIATRVFREYGAAEAERAASYLNALSRKVGETMASKGKSDGSRGSSDAPSI